MKTIIDSEQAERLKEVCEKYGVRLPDVHRFAVESMDEDTMTITRPELGKYTLELTDLLEMLPKYVDESTPTFYYHDDFWTAIYENKELFKKCIFVGVELIDALFELFIWVIENGYYRGSATNSAL